VRQGGGWCVCGGGGGGVQTRVRQLVGTQCRDTVGDEVLQQVSERTSVGILPSPPASCFLPPPHDPPCPHTHLDCAVLARLPVDGAALSLLQHWLTVIQQVVRLGQHLRRGGMKGGRGVDTGSTTRECVWVWESVLKRGR
jgi:hypothetical protein